VERWGGGGSGLGKVRKLGTGPMPEESKKEDANRAAPFRGGQGGQVCPQKRNGEVGLELRHPRKTRGRPAESFETVQFQEEWDLG